MSETGTLTALRFKSLYLSREEYGADKGKLKAKINVDFYKHALEVHVPDDVAVEIMRMCVPTISASVHGGVLP